MGSTMIQSRAGGHSPAQVTAAAGITSSGCESLGRRYQAGYAGKVKRQLEGRQLCTSIDKLAARPFWHCATPLYKGAGALSLPSCSSRKWPSSALLMNTRRTAALGDWSRHHAWRFSPSRSNDHANGHDEHGAGKAGAVRSVKGLSGAGAGAPDNENKERALALALDAAFLLQHFDALKAVMASVMAAQVVEDGTPQMVLQFILAAQVRLDGMAKVLEDLLKKFESGQREPGSLPEGLTGFVQAAIALFGDMNRLFGSKMRDSSDIPEQLLEEVASFAKVKLLDNGSRKGGLAWPSEPAKVMAQRLLPAVNPAADEATEAERHDTLAMVGEQCRATVISLNNGLAHVKDLLEPKAPFAELLSDTDFSSPTPDQSAERTPINDLFLQVSLRVPESLRIWFKGSRTDQTASAAGAASLLPQVPVQLPYNTQRVFFATDRKEDTNCKEGVLAYTWEMEDGGPQELATGWTNVSIPLKWEDGKKRRPGEMGPEPAVDSSEPFFHIVLLPGQNELFTRDSEGQAAFRQSLKAEVDRTGGELLLFIHGYNVPFQGAIRSAAQLAFDLGKEPGAYGGAVLAYDWASCGATWRYGFLPGLDNDIDRAKRSASKLASILKQLTTVLPMEPGQSRKRLHIVAHSMGNLVLKEALDQLKEERAQLAAFRMATSTVTFAAPDVSREEFAAMVDVLVPPAGDTGISKAEAPLVATLFCSNGDLALLASSLLRLAAFGGYRAGIFRIWWISTRGHRVHPLLLTSQMDTVDASGFARDSYGHGYFSNNESLLAEISQIINFCKRADDRLSLGKPAITKHVFKCGTCVDWFQVKAL